jgi:hypothetical protein
MAHMSLLRWTHGEAAPILRHMNYLIEESDPED